MSHNNGKWKLSENFVSNLLLVMAGVLFYVGVSYINVLGSVLYRGYAIISPFVAGMVIAYLLDFVVRGLESLLSIKRAFCVLIAYLLALLVIGILLNLVVPQVISSFSMLITNIPDYFNSLSAYVDSLMQKNSGNMLETANLEGMLGTYREFVDKMGAKISTMMPQVITYGRAIGSGLVGAVTALISSIYMLLDKQKLLRQIRKVSYTLLSKKRADRLLFVSGQANRIFGGFVSGKLIDSLIIGVLCFLLTSILKIPYAVLVSVVIGVTNIIPFFGPIIGAIPCTLILLIVHPFSALEFVILILCLQQFDGNILGPKILGDSTGLSALWVLVAITVGSGVFGFAGMLIGVPAFAVIYSLLAETMDRILLQKGLDAAGNPLPQTEAAAPCTGETDSVAEAAVTAESDAESAKTE